MSSAKESEPAKRTIEPALISPERNVQGGQGGNRTSENIKKAEEAAGRAKEKD